MASNITKSAVIRAGKLKREDFKSFQEFADAIAEALIVSFDASDPGLKGDKGDAGKTPQKNVREFGVPNGDSSIDVGFDCSEMQVNLVNDVDTPTIGILGMNTEGIITLSGAAPTGNYIIKITDWSTEE